MIQSIDQRKNIITNLHSLYDFCSKQLNKTEYYKSTDFKSVHPADSAWPGFSYNFSKKYNSPEAISELSALIGNEKAAPFLITCSDIDNFDTTLLSAENIRMIQNFSGMIYSGDSSYLPDIGTEVKLISQDREVMQWKECVETELFNGKNLSNRIIVPLFHSPQTTFLMIEINGEIAATSMIYHNNKCAGLYMICTSKKYRRKGFGHAITSASIQHAYEKGANTIILQATQSGKPLYLKMGFEMINTFNIYWKIS